MELRNYLIYIHTSPTGRSYIGLTNNFDRRCTQHKSAAANGTGCKAFGNAIRRYGWDAFTHEVLVEGLTAAEAKDMEVKLIAEYNTMSPNGYNLSTGGEHGVHAPEVIERIAAKNRGKKRSPEVCAAISEASRNRSPETLAKIGASVSAALKGKPKSPEHVEAVRSALYSDPQKAAAKSEKRADTVRGTKYDTSKGGSKAMWANRTQEEKDAIQVKRLAKLDRTTQADKARAAHASMTDEQKAQRSANIKAALVHRVKTPEQKDEARLRRNELQRVRRAAKRPT